MIIVSACLAGIPCRYDGKRNTRKKIQELVREGKAIPVCPEQLGGLPTPRPASEIQSGKVVNTEGRDVSHEFRRGAEIVLAIAQEYGCEEAILKSRSPSCGKGTIYDGTFSGKTVSGNGITADLLIRNGIKVRTEENI
ncbi:MAG TPA: DUF523 domain-containing protein [Syntrophales bacterium]|nr:DUF523 domain-containing protein [Syntrophales bacterium]